MTILDKIVAQKRIEVAQQKELVSTKELENHPNMGRVTFSLKDSIVHPERTGIITEFKRQSPSKGVINGNADIVEITTGYTQNGSSCLSVLTDEVFFGGHVEDLRSARVNQIPILRKDFMIDAYQVLEAKAIGADVILLIAACLTPQKVKELTHVAHDLDLEVLLELYTEDELDCYDDSVDLVGVNNRNLKTFEVNINNSINLLNKLPKNKLSIAESGIQDPATVVELKKAGFNGFLMGEHFMRTSAPHLAFKEYVAQLKSLEHAD